MRWLIIFLFVLPLAQGSVLCQIRPDSSSLSFILIPHPRSEDKMHLSVLPSIAEIDLSRYDMTLLGGDLTWYTSLNRTSMDYCDSLFDLSNPNTLWALGNHDLNNRSLIEEYTHRPGYYVYGRDSIVFVVLDVELNANGFQSSFIHGEQLDMIQQVCDTTSHAGWLVFLHGRHIWMIGNPDFTTRLDSVAESTRQMDTTNFYADIYPLLQHAKQRGLQILCLGGDKSKINIDYSPEDSIWFMTSTMAPEFADSLNDVLVFNYFKSSNTLQHQFIPLLEIPKKQISGFMQEASGNNLIRTWQSSGSGDILIQPENNTGFPVNVQVFSITGKMVATIRIQDHEAQTIHLVVPGVYILRSSSGGVAGIQKLLVW